jgi:molybdopterin synthase sulfur carrier subunit
MPTVRFTDNIQRHVECPTRAVNGARVRDALDAYFAANPRARGYVLDEQGRLREHMAIFVNGGQLRDRVGLTDPVDDEGVIDVIQALSGGER